MDPAVTPAGVNPAAPMSPGSLLLNRQQVKKGLLKNLLGAFLLQGTTNTCDDLEFVNRMIHLVGLGSDQQA